MEDLDIAVKMEEDAERVLDALRDLLAGLLQKGSSVHGEYTVADAIAKGEASDILTFDVGNSDEKIAAREERNFREMQKKLQQNKKENAVGKVCYLCADLSDGRSAIIFRDRDRERVEQLAKELDAPQIQRMQDAKIRRDDGRERKEKVR